MLLESYDVNFLDHIFQVAKARFTSCRDSNLSMKSFKEPF